MKKFVSASVAVSLLFLFLLTSAQQGAGVYKIGQKVEAWNIAWYKATILEIGSGTNSGYIKVHYDDFSSASDQYLKESSIRIPKDAALKSSATAPRNGRYTIRSYGGNPKNPIILGYFDLNNGNYKYYNAGKTLIGTGAYQYESASKKVLWQSGGLKKYSDTATFEISREGKTHQIQLKYGTSASNSSDN